jgi:hypothetical protein
MLAVLSSMWLIIGQSGRCGPQSESERQTQSAARLLTGSTCRAPRPTEQVPIAVAATGFYANLPGANLSSSAPLRMDACTLARIFTGNVTSWDHPAIQQLNPGARSVGRAAGGGARAGRALCSSRTAPLPTCSNCPPAAVGAQLPSLACCFIPRCPQAALAADPGAGQGRQERHYLGGHPLLQQGLPTSLVTARR